MPLGVGSVPNVTAQPDQLTLDQLTPDRLTAVAGVPPARPLVEVRRSARRRRTVQAHRDGDTTVVMIPARMSKAEESRWVEVMLARLDGQERRRRPSDTALAARAARLSTEHLGGRARPSSVRWVDNQAARWGSCTPEDATIRLSSRMQGMPGWVVDYVLVHELAHLLEPTHSARFWGLVAAYPRAERARGYLEGVVAAGRAAGPADDPAAAPTDDPADDPADDPGSCTGDGRDADERRSAS